MLGYIVFVCLLLLFYSRRAPKAMLLVMILFAVLRYDVGWDYNSYYELANDVNALELAKERYSLLWTVLFGFAYELGMPHLAIAIPAVITYVALFVSLSILLDDQKDHMSDALLVYGLWPFFYLGSFSTIRQNLAMAVAFVIFAMLYHRRWLWALLLYIVNYYIHPSSLVIILILPLFFIRYKIKWYWIALIMVTLLVLIGNWISVVEVMNIETFNEYAETYQDFEDNFGGTLSLLYGLVALFIIGVLLIDKKITYWQHNIMVIVALSLIATIYIYNSGMPSVVTRIISYFTIFLLLIFYASLHSFPQRHIYRTGLTMMLVLLFFVYLQRTSIGAAQGLATSGYVPYKTIIFQ